MLIEPFPDELAISHEARSLRIHDIGTEAGHDVFLRERFDCLGQGRQGKIARLYLLAMSAGIDVVRYTQFHSMLPSLRVVVPDAGSNDGWASMAFHRGLEIQAQHARICIDCVEADQLRYGVSWFHRAHHLIGVDWCSIHGRVLHQVFGAKPFRLSPDEWCSRGDIELSSGVEGGMPTGGWQRRYVDLALKLAEQPWPASCQTLNAYIAKRARKFGFKTGLVEDGSLLSDYLVDLVGRQWIDRNMRSLSSSVCGVPVSAVDGFLLARRNMRTGETYTLVLACLYETVEEALAAVELCRVGMQPDEEEAKSVELA